MWRVRRREEIINISGRRFLIQEFTLSDAIIYSSFLLAENKTKLSLLFPQNDISSLSVQEEALLLQKVEDINKEISFPRKSFSNNEKIKLSLEELIVVFSKQFNKDPLEIINKYTKNQLLFWSYVNSCLNNMASQDTPPDPDDIKKDAPEIKSAQREPGAELKFDDLMQRKEVKK